MKRRGIMFLGACIGLASLFAFVVAHEGMHLLLSTKPVGICIGYCEIGLGYLSWQPSLSYAVHNALSGQELYPNLAGFVSMLFVALTGLFYSTQLEVS